MSEEATTNPTPMRLRAEPPRVTRLSRKMLAGAGAVALLGIGGALIYALQTRDMSGNGECQRRRKTRPLGGAKPGQYSRHAGKRREGVARAVLACVRGDFRRTVQADWPDFRALL